MNRSLFKAVMLQFSGTVGAGIFVLPYLFQRSNFFFSTICLFALATTMVLLNLSYAEIILNTPGDHQLSGYVHRYLGTKFKYLATLNVLFLGLGALVAYLHLASNFLVVLFPTLHPLLAIIIFILLVLIFHFDGFKPQESIVNLLPYIGIFIVLILFISSFLLSPATTSLSSDPNLLLFGTLVFALSGFTIVPEIEETLRHSPQKTHHLRLAIITGITLVAVVYLYFTFAIIKLSGPNLSPDSVTGINISIPFLGKLIAIFGLVTLFRASLNFLFVFKEIFYRDFKIGHRRSYLFSAIAPILAYLVSHVTFIRTLSFVGTVSTLIAAILICAVHYKIRPTSRIVYISMLIITVFLFALIHEFKTF